MGETGDRDSGIERVIVWNQDLYDLMIARINRLNCQMSESYQEI
jgi:hypothetical protein